jgi:uncharacterized membrane protein YiaA
MNPQICPRNFKTIVMKQEALNMKSTVGFKNEPVDCQKQKPMKSQKPTGAFIGASWFALGLGLISYCIGLWHANSLLSSKGYYFTIIFFGLFSVISVQKSVRDKIEGVPVTDIYHGISWFVTILSIVLLVIGLWNAQMSLSEKGFFGMAFILSLFGSVAVQKNVRDLKLFKSMS